MLSIGNCCYIADCSIRHSTGYNGRILWGLSLVKMGIIDNNRMNMLISTILNDPNIGLPHFNSTIDPNVFNILSGQSTFINLVDCIHDNAVIPQ